MNSAIHWIMILSSLPKRTAGCDYTTLVFLITAIQLSCLSKSVNCELHGMMDYYLFRPLYSGNCLCDK